MTSEQLHDAISLLPADLITEADKVRCAPKVPLRWQRYAAMAASLVLVITGGYLCIRMHYLNIVIGRKSESAPEAPAAMMQAAPVEETAADRSADAAPAEAADPESAAGSGQTNSAAVCTAVPVLELLDGGTPVALTEEAQTQLLQMLRSLSYRKEDVCECIAEITAIAEDGTSYHINLEEGFVRCASGQAALTAEQIDTIAKLLEGSGS